MNIDVDTHYSPPEMFADIPKALKDAPRLVVDHRGRVKLWMSHLDSYTNLNESSYNLKFRMDAMKEAGFDKQCLLVANGSIPEPFIAPETSRHLCKAWNNRVADLVEENDCFIGVAQIPHCDPDSAIEETRRAVRELGFHAVQIHGSWGPRNIEDYEWWPFFEEVEKLGVPLWYHGTNFYAAGKLNPYMPGSQQVASLPRGGAIITFLWQPQLMMTGLILSGTLEKFRRLKVVFTECDGGWVPTFMDWVDMMYNNQQMNRQSPTYAPTTYFRVKPAVEDVNLPKKPSAYVREHFFFALTNTRGYEMSTMLDVLVNRVNLQRNLLIESDYDHLEGSVDIVRRVRQMETIDQESRDLICGRNAAELLGIEWRPSIYNFAK